MITVQQKLECARRELQMREKVYPRWVTDGRMSVEKMNHEIAVMREIVADYQRAFAQMDLFA